MQKARKKKHVFRKPTGHATNNIKNVIAILIPAFYFVNLPPINRPLALLFMHALSNGKQKVVYILPLRYGGWVKSIQLQLLCIET